MAEKFQNKYRIPSARLKNWDYRTNAAYFVTISTIAIAIAKNEKMAAIAPKTGSLSTIIRSYKSAVTKNARKIHADFNWQPRFHDHIIRNDESHIRIQKYIINNPGKWADDKWNEEGKINSNT